jgi:hypothetical protein
MANHSERTIRVTSGCMSVTNVFTLKARVSDRLGEMLVEATRSTGPTFMSGRSEIPSLRDFNRELGSAENGQDCMDPRPWVCVQQSRAQPAPPRLHSALHTRVDGIERRRAADVQTVSLLAAEAQIRYRLRYVGCACLSGGDLVGGAPLDNFTRWRRRIPRHRAKRTNWQPWFLGPTSGAVPR